MRHAELLGDHRNLIHEIGDTWSKGGSCRADAQHLVSADALHRCADALYVRLERIGALLRTELHNHRRESSCSNGLEAGLLVNARPDHIATFGSHLPQRQEHQRHREARGRRQHAARLGGFDASQSYGVQRQVTRQLHYDRRSRRLRLLRHDIAATANAMREAKVSFSHEAGDDPALALANTDIAHEVVRVHGSKFLEQHPDGGVVPTLIGQSPLR
mmetsp:Transcript_62257/g.160542  ORF Transcript_62257/g.160542 Transcript_62257/m.160542 type:complete len:216 (+) Transcript_62257:448-1095(+)